MKKLFRIVAFTLIASISFLSTPLFATEEESIGLTAGIEYASKSMWRGMYLYDKEGIFYPFLTYDVLDTGLSLTVLAGLAEAYIFDKEQTVFKDNQYMGFCIDYSNNFGLVTLGAGFHYYMYHWEREYDYSETYVSFALEDFFLSPTLTIIYDYYFGEVDGDAGKDFYIQLGIGHSFDLISEIVSLDLGASIGYYSSSVEAEKVSGISDIDLSIGLSVDHNSVNYFAGFHYVIVPSKDFYYHEAIHTKNINSTVKDKHRFYSVFGVSHSF